MLVHVEEENVDELINSYKKDFPNIEFWVPESGVFVQLSDNSKKIVKGLSKLCNSIKTKVNMGAR